MTNDAELIDQIVKNIGDLNWSHQHPGKFKEEVSKRLLRLIAAEALRTIRELER